MNEQQRSQLGRAAVDAFARRDWAQAHARAVALAQHWPDDANANQVLGLLALERGDLKAARGFLERASAAAPNQTPILNSLGVTLRRLGETNLARATFRRAAEIGALEAWRNLGNLEDASGNSKAAISAFQALLRAAPNDASGHGALAHLFESRHDIVRAKTHIARALAANPTQPKALIAKARVHLREGEAAEAEKTALPLTLSQHELDANKAIAWGLIGQARDRLDDAPRAFAAFSAGNEILLRRNAHLLGADEHLYHPASVRRLIDPARRTNVNSVDENSPAPVFLVGFPRSGTTLLDQILSSHSRVQCVEEQPYFAQALADTLGATTHLERALSFDASDVEKVRDRYLSLIGGSGTSGQIVVDKLPLNIVALPLITHIFPRAKIIFALRDPRDSVLSCFQQQFGMNAAMVQFLAIDTAASYYDLVMTLFETCRAEGVNAHQVRYEDVVADLEGEARKLAQFLGVPFEARMLDYQSTARARDIRTPSVRQVVQPLYTRSIGRWRRYAEQLAPALPVLNAWAARFGYEV